MKLKTKQTQFVGYIVGEDVSDAPNKHSDNELFLYMGTTPQDTHDLGGEVEYLLDEDDEAERLMGEISPSMFYAEDY